MEACLGDGAEERCFYLRETCQLVLLYFLTLLQQLFGIMFMFRIRFCVLVYGFWHLHFC